jgi:hypothetical protein
MQCTIPMRDQHRLEVKSPRYGSQPLHTLVSVNGVAEDKSYEKDNRTRPRHMPYRLDQRGSKRAPYTCQYQMGKQSKRVRIHHSSQHAKRAWRGSWAQVEEPGCQLEQRPQRRVRDRRGASWRQSVVLRGDKRIAGRNGWDFVAAESHAVR